MLGQRFPDDAIVGEELDNAPFAAGRPVWYVDPIDGTTNFANGLRWCSFSLALADGAGMALGVVADVWRDEVFSAVRGQGALPLAPADWATGRSPARAPSAAAGTPAWPGAWCSPSSRAPSPGRA